MYNIVLHVYNIVLQFYQKKSIYSIEVDLTGMFSPPNSTIEKLTTNSWNPQKV